LGGVSSFSPVQQFPLPTVAQGRGTAILLGLGFCLATVLGWFGSRLALMPTQAMNGREPFGKMLIYFSLALIFVYVRASVLGSIILLAVPHSWRLWAWGVGGLVAGAGLAGLLVTIASLFPSPLFLYWPMLLSAFWLPPVAGLAALLLKKSA
jgi:hypothetical protein